MKRYLRLLAVPLMLLMAACAGASSAKPVEITLGTNAMRYQPATIEVTAGQPVRLTFRNTDTVDHDFSVMEIPVTVTGGNQDPMANHDMSHMSTEPQLHVAAPAGKSSTLEFTPTKPGTYEFFCTVTGHKEAGMKGTLVVKGP